MKVCCILSNAFFCTSWDDHVIFILHSINVGYHTDWFVYVEPARDSRAFSDLFYGYTCSTFLFPLEVGRQKSENCMPSFDPEKSGWVLTASHLLSLKWYWMFTIVFFSLCWLNLAGCKHMLSIWLERFTLKTLEGMHKDPATGRRSLCMRDAEHCGCPWTT